MSQVTGNIFSLTTQPGTKKITFQYLSAPAIIGDSIVSSQDDVVPPIDGYGDFQVTLAAGNYKVTVGTLGQSRDVFTILVPTGTGTYTFASIVTSSVTALPGPVGGGDPTATSTVSGYVRTIKDTAVPVVPTGIYYPNDVAALLAIQTRADSHTFATLIKRQAGEPKSFYWDDASLAAHDMVGFTALLPTDRTAGQPGRWIQDT